MLRIILKIVLLFSLISANVIGQNKNYKKFKAYPCPTNGVVNIDVFDFTQSDPKTIHTFIKVYNMQGQLIKVQPLNISSNPIQIHASFYLTEYPSGNYFLTIETGYVIYVS